MSFDKKGKQEQAELSGLNAAPAEGSAGPMFAEGSVGEQEPVVQEEGSQGPPRSESEEVEPVDSPTQALLSRPLWDIGHEYVQLVDYLTERGGEMDEDSIVAWDEIRGAVVEKLENCCLMVRTLEAHGLVVKGEADRLRDRAKAVTGRKEKLKDYIQHQMERMEIEKSEGVALSVRIQKNQPKCEVYDLDLVPAEYCNVTIQMSGTGWDNLQAVLSTVIPDQTDLEQAIDHWGGVWGVTRKVDVSRVVQECKASAGAEDVPGTKTEQGSSLRIW